MNRSTPPERTRARFDRWAPGYDRNWGQVLFFDRVHRAVVQTARESGLQPSAILDVGCGTGRLLFRARATFPKAQVVGIDLSPGMIEQARSKVPADGAMRFETAGVEQLPFADGSFDLVLSTISFHHWADRAAGLREVSRVLRRAGVFILADIFLGGPFHPLLWLFGRLHGPFRTISETQQMLEQAGLAVHSQHYPAALAWSILISIGQRR